MLNPEYFAKTMLTLQQAYTNFNLTKEQLEVWYNFFKNCTEQEFKDMVQVFLNTNIYPPLGANHIKQVYYDEMKKQLKDREMTADEAWNLVRGAIRIHSPYYSPDKYIDYIKRQNEVAGKLAEEYLHEINGATTEQLDFLATRFKKSYEVMLQRKVEDDQLKLANQTIKNLLGNKEV